MENELLAKYTSLFTAVKTFSTLKSQVDALNSALVQAQKKEEEIREGKARTLAIPGLILGCIFGVTRERVLLWTILGLIGGALLGTIIYLLLFMNRNERKADSYHNDTVIPITNKLLVLNEQLQAAMDDPDFQRASDPAEVPERYQTLAALEFFVSALQARRADTEKELYNLYEAQLQHESLLAKQSESVAYAKAALAENIRHNQKTEQQLEEQAAQQRKQSKMTERQLAEISSQNQKLSKQVKYGNIVNTVGVAKQFKDSKKK